MMFLSYLPLKLMKTLMGGAKNLGMEALFLLLHALLGIFILVAFWTFVMSFGKIDLIRYFMDKILDGMDKIIDRILRY